MESLTTYCLVRYLYKADVPFRLRRGSPFRSLSMVLAIFGPQSTSCSVFRTPYPTAILVRTCSSTHLRPGRAPSGGQGLDWQDVVDQRHIQAPWPGLSENRDRPELNRGDRLYRRYLQRNTPYSIIQLRKPTNVRRRECPIPDGAPSGAMLGFIVFLFGK